RLVRDAHDVVLRLLCDERDTGRLCMRPQPPRLLLPRAVHIAHPLRPDPAGRTELRDFLEEVVVDVEEERQPRREVVDIETALDAALDVLEAVAQRVRQLLRGRGARLTD